MLRIHVHQPDTLLTSLESELRVIGEACDDIDVSIVLYEASATHIHYERQRASATDSGDCWCNDEVKCRPLLFARHCDATGLGFDTHTGHLEEAHGLERKSAPTPHLPTTASWHG